MPHHHKHQHDPHRPPPTEGQSTSASPPVADRRLELVVKADTGDAVQAVLSSLLALSRPEVKVVVVGHGVGDINKNDLFTAATSSRLILGFNVAALPHIAEACHREGIEVRLYSVIYTLIEDLRRLVASLLPAAGPVETVTGTAKVIALFKSTRKGIILGCEVQSGRLARGDQFRLISTPGVIYLGSIQSLHIGRDTVNQALAGQQAGIKLDDFNQARIGDLVECLKSDKPAASAVPWRPQGGVRLLDSPA